METVNQIYILKGLLWQPPEKNDSKEVRIEARDYLILFSVHVRINGRLDRGDNGEGNEE